MAHIGFGYLATRSQNAQVRPNYVFSALSLHGGFPTLWLPFLGALLRKIVICWGLCWAPLILGSYRISNGLHC